MPTQEQIDQWKAEITKKHYGEIVVCFACPEIDWSLFEVSHRPCVHNSRFMSQAVCRKNMKINSGKGQFDDNKGAPNR